MKGERLFQLLGLVDPELIEEAMSVPAAPRRRAPWRAIAAAAACLVLVVGAGLGGRLLLAGGGSGNMAAGSDGAAAGGEAGESVTGDGIAGEGGAATAFMSYAGPVFPLTTAEADTGLTAERTVTWDFAMGAYEDGSPRQWGAQVTDDYVLTNPTDSDITVTALYPFAGTLAGLGTIGTTVTVDGAETPYALHAGPYAGGFRDAGVDDGSTWNLSPPDSFDDYVNLLESGAYLSQTLGEAPELDTPVTAYWFTDFAAPHDQYRAATQAVTLSIDPEETTILTYGFNGFSRNEDNTRQRYDYFVPDGVQGETDTKVLLVLGEDLGDYTLQGYADGGCEEPIEGVSCTVTRQETTLDAVLEELCRAELANQRQTSQWPGLADLSPALYQRAVTETVLSSGVLADTPADRYIDGRLDDLLWDVLVQERVLYLSFPVTVPAGGGVTVSAGYWKAPSYDFGCSGSENVGLQGYDLATALGSNLVFTSQTAALANTENIEIVRQNLGFDLENGVTEVTLDPAEPHYYLEIRPLEG